MEAQPAEAAPSAPSVEELTVLIEQEVRRHFSNPPRPTRHCVARSQKATIAALEETLAADTFKDTEAGFSLFSAPIGMMLIGMSHAAPVVPLYNNGGVAPVLERAACRFGPIEPPQGKLASCLALLLRDEPLLA